MGDYKFGFEKLDVYKLGKELVNLVYNHTKKFPDTERFGLISQLNRASISVASNIAEGNSRATSKDKAHLIYNP